MKGAKHAGTEVVKQNIAGLLDVVPIRSQVKRCLLFLSICQSWV